MTTAKKRPPGRWKAGESGNPAGRKPGTGEVAKVRAAIAARVPELLAAMMARALEGDVGVKGNRIFPSVVIQISPPG